MVKLGLERIIKKLSFGVKSLATISALAVLIPSCIQSKESKAPLEGRVVFVSNKDGRNSLSLMSYSPDFEEVSIRPLKYEGRFDFRNSNISASPDGRLVFDEYKEEENVYRLFILDLQTGRTKQITHEGYSDLRPAWSPKGDEIMFAKQYGSLNHDICAVNPEGSGFRKLTDTEESQETWPTCSPDGERVAFVSDTFPDKSDHPTENSIYVIDRDGKNSVRILKSNSPILELAWSPKGDRIAYVRYSKGSHFDIFLIDSAGKEEPINKTDYGSQEESPHLSATSVSWSPDGQFILFGSSKGAGRITYDISPNGRKSNERYQSDYDSDICAIRVDGKSEVITIAGNPSVIEKEPVCLPSLK